jgi:adenosylcobinamide kinase/adenosylcobinamide-phosphate guanylyltransferase
LLPPVTFVLGGARSGKSVYAEQIIGEPGPGLYLATADAGDDEMAERIRKHRARRGPGWETLEEPLDLAGAIARCASPDRPILVDCLTLWLSNLLGAQRDVDAAIHGLLAILERPNGSVVLVSNEVGFGIVPATPLGRIFRDHAGRLNQAVAGIAGRVVLVTAGLPLILKDVAPANPSQFAKDQTS